MYVNENTIYFRKVKNNNDNSMICFVRFPKNFRVRDQSLDDLQQK